MKNALLLHGTDNNPHSNWLPWLERQLQQLGYTVRVPNLPRADQPSTNRYNRLLLNHQDWQYNSDTIIVGHSSGAVAILGLLQALPEVTRVKACYLVGSFKNDLGCDQLKKLFTTPFDFEQIKTKSDRFVFIHSDNDPYCPLEHARYLSAKLDGELVILPGQKHFSISTVGEQYKKFPQLLSQITS